MPAAFDIRPRTAVCLDCRTLMAFDERCDLGHPPHRRLSVPAVDPRGALHHEIWQSAWSASGSHLRRTAPARQPQPLGIHHPVLPRASERVAGVVEGTATTFAPATGRPCLAWQIALCSVVHDFGPMILLDAIAAGFKVVPSDGEPVEVRPGRVRFAVAPVPVPIVRPDTFGHWLGAINDPWRPSSALPFTEVRETILVPGERIELDGPFDSTADPGGSHGYREAPSTILVPRYIPRIYF